MLRRLLAVLLLVLLVGCQPAIPAPTVEYRPRWNPGDLGPIVTDIESHLWPGHPYRDADRITWVHEGTHGINSVLRNAYHCPAFYVLQNRVFLMPEPATTLAAVADCVPPTLRGPIFKLYLVNARPSWDSQPTYVFDEWTAYTNGMDARHQLGIPDRRETIDYALEMVVYSLCVPMASGSGDEHMKAFLVWQLNRVKALAGHEAFRRVREASDGAALRQFIKGYFGPVYTYYVFGF